MSKDRFSIKDGTVLDNGKARYFSCEHLEDDVEYLDLGDLFHDWFCDDEFHKVDFDVFIDQCLSVDGFREITEEEYKKGVDDGE